MLHDLELHPDVRSVCNDCKCPYTMDVQGDVEEQDNGVDGVAAGRHEDALPADTESFFSAYRAGQCAAGASFKPRPA